LGFGALFALLRAWQGKRLTTHAIFVLGASVALVLGGTLLLWLLECRHEFAGVPVVRGLKHAFFQSVTTRTAGFNTMDLARLQPATQLVMMALMFVGAAPGSTGGGVKVTTVVVLFAVMRAVLQGREAVVLGSGQVSAKSVRNAVALWRVAGMGLAVGLLVLLTTQKLSPMGLAFETVSALGTVGLSLGLTAALTPVGKLCIVVLMFVGRVGPLTLLVMMRPRKRPAVKYPVADIMIG